MDKKYKYATLDADYLLELTKIYVEELGYSPYDAQKLYKKGRPYVIIPKDENTSYALGVYSGKNQNFFLENKNDDLAKQLFYFMNEERIGNQYIRPYVSLRSPLIVDNRFIHEMKKEYLIDLEKKVGHVPSIAVTLACLNQAENNYEMIENQFLLLKDNYRLLKNNMSGLQKQAYLTNKHISEDVFNNNENTFFKVNDRAFQVLLNKGDFIKNNSKFSNEFKQTIKENAIVDNKISTEYIADRLSRKTPLLYDNQRKKMSQLHGELGILMMHTSYVNGNFDSNNYIVQTKPANNVVAKEYLRENSKFIVEMENKNNSFKNDFNGNKNYQQQKLIYMFNKTFNRKDKENNNVKNKQDFINKIIKSNPHIEYIDEKNNNLKSYIVTYINKEPDKNFSDLYYPELTNNKYGVHCYINKNENVDVAINMILTTYSCNLLRKIELDKEKEIKKEGKVDFSKLRMTKDLETRKKYDFGHLFFFDERALTCELLNIEIKRLITEKYKIEFDANEYSFFSEKGEEILTNLKQNTVANYDALLIFQTIDNDIKRSTFENNDRNFNNKEEQFEK